MSTFTADQVWGLAVRADTLNGGYCKEPVFAATATHGIDYNQKIKEANKVLVKQWLRDNEQPTAEEIAAGQECRRYFNTFTMKLLTGKINDFERTALSIAQKDEFTGRDMLDFAVVSCLPSCAVRDQQRMDEKREIYNSEQLQGDVGDTIVGDITVIRTRYNPEYQKHKVYARMGESFVDFWYHSAITGDLRIKAKIKQHRGDKTTALNYVKKA
jgi:hypothetical protein